MLKLTLEYVDFNNNKQVEDLYFNITSTELANRELRSNGTWFDKLKEIQESSDGQAIMDRFDEIIGLAYGERSEDGKYFRKSEKIIDDFRSTAAYDAFFLKVCTNADYAAEFISKVLPADLIEKVKKAQADEERLRPRSITEVELPPQATPPVVWPPQA